ncbi:PEP-CTERM sorting domain-containing protein [Roseateles sp. BYS78W]
MRAMSKLLALALAAALQPAFAGMLDFNDITNSDDAAGFGMVQLMDRYLLSDGVQFTGGAWGERSAYNCDGFNSFVAHDLSCGAVQLASDPHNVKSSSDVSFTINFADGFTTGSSFYYSALKDTRFSITVYDQLDGKGTGKAIAASTSATCDVSGLTFCDWSLADLQFAGTAYSIVVKGADQTFMLDDLNLIQAPANPNPAPEPGSIALALGGLGALGWSRRRAARR